LSGTSLDKKCLWNNNNNLCQEIKNNCESVSTNNKNDCEYPGAARNGGTTDGNVIKCVWVGTETDLNVKKCQTVVGRCDEIEREKTCVTSGAADEGDCFFEERCKLRVFVNYKLQFIYYYSFIDTLGMFII
jgi:hypothetical protein